MSFHWFAAPLYRPPMLHSLTLQDVSQTQLHLLLFVCLALGKAEPEIYVRIQFIFFLRNCERRSVPWCRTIRRGTKSVSNTLYIRNYIHLLSTIEMQTVWWLRRCHGSYITLRDITLKCISYDCLAVLMSVGEHVDGVRVELGILLDLCDGLGVL